MIFTQENQLLNSQWPTPAQSLNTTELSKRTTAEHNRPQQQQQQQQRANGTFSCKKIGIRRSITTLVFFEIKATFNSNFFPIRPFPIFNWFDRSKISVVTKVFFHSVIFFSADAGRSVFVAWSEKPNHAISFNSDLSYKRANIRY